MTAILADDVERIIMHYYPRRRLEPPSANTAVGWEHDPGLRKLREVTRELEKIHAPVHKGARGGLEVSEEWIVGGRLRVQLSYLGPYAALNFGHAEALDEDLSRLYEAVERALGKHGVTVLNLGELEASVPWIDGARATVWSCLFDPR